MLSFHQRMPCVGVDSVEGFVLINRRKQKLIPTYELHVKGSWKGEVKDGSGESIGEGPLQHTAVRAEYRQCWEARCTCYDACRWQIQSISKSSGPCMSRPSQPPAVHLCRECERVVGAALRGR